MSKTIILLGGLLFSTFSLAAESESIWNSDNHYRGAAKSAPAFDLPAALVPGNFPQYIDHFGNLPGQTFAQRFWVDSEYASSPETAPVIYHICGEGDAAQGYFLKDNAIEWAKALGAHLVYLEHRYYGQSLPFADFSTEHLQYLTLDNVMEDLATFQQSLAASQGWRGKWITVGGSYSATLSAIYRYRHPELVVGALAASAPMISGSGVPDDANGDLAGLKSIDPSSDTGERPWVYQACTTFAFWQTDGSTVFDPSQRLCQQLFGNTPVVDSNAYNQIYMLPFLSNVVGAPSNILFTYGTADIWTTIGLNPQENANPAITIQMIEGGGHHFDLNYPDPSDSPAVTEARAEFLALAHKWLSQN